jgi:hypothetical protein
VLHGLDVAEQFEHRGLQAHQRLAPRVAGVQLGGQPALGTFGAGVHLDEMLARNVRLVHEDVLDLALVRADLFDQAAHAVAQPLDRARGEADRHQLIGDLVAHLEVILVARALVLQRLLQLLEQAADAIELLHRLALELEQAGRLRGVLLFLRDALVFLDLGFLVLLGGRRGGLPRLEFLFRVRVDEAVDHLVDARLVLLHLLCEDEDFLHRGRAGADRLDHVAQAVLDALGDLDLAFAREQLHRAHLAHVHAHRVGGAAELRIHRGERSLGLLLDVLVGLGDGLRVGGDEEGFLVGRLVVDLDAHVAERGDDGFDLLRVDQVVGQVVVDLRVGEEAAVLAELDQVLKPRAAGFGVFLRHLRRDQPGVLLALAAQPALALRLRRSDVGFQQLERGLRALDRGLARDLAFLDVLRFRGGFSRRRLERCSGLAGENLFQRLSGRLGLLRRRPAVECQLLSQDLDLIDFFLGLGGTARLQFALRFGHVASKWARLDIRTRKKVRDSTLWRRRIAAFCDNGAREKSVPKIRPTARCADSSAAPVPSPARSDAGPAADRCSPWS